MNLTYNVLWIENELDWYTESKDLVELLVEEEGFFLSSLHKSSENEITELISKDGFKAFDLILVDFNLDNGDRGSAIIENIRNHQIFTEVLFYSQNIEGVKEAIKSNELEGVYISKRDREDFEYKFEKVFKTTIKKVQDVSAIRGLVMAETSKMDRKIEGIISKFHDCSDENIQLKIKKYIIDKLKSSTKSSFNKAGKLTTDVEITVLLNERIFDSYKKMQTVGEIIEIADIKDINKCDFINNYNTKVLQMRNNLAHVEELQDKEGNTFLKTYNGELIIDDEKCKEIRNDIIIQDEILTKVFETIC